MSYIPDVPRYDIFHSRGGDYVEKQWHSGRIKCELFLLEQRVNRTRLMCRVSYLLHCRLHVGKLVNSDCRFLNFAVFGKGDMASFGKCSVTETYFNCGLLSVWETVMLELTTKFHTFIAAILLPDRSSSYTRFVWGSVKHWYIYRKISDNLTCFLDNVSSWHNTIATFIFVDEFSGLRTSLLTKNCFVNSP
jgi:hypothetical protein